MGVLANWRESRRRREMAERYLDALAGVVQKHSRTWLSEVVPRAEAPLREREWQWAVRAIALIVAERDALDDRTAADVAHAVEARNGREDAGWSARWQAYHAALAQRGGREAPLTRLARVFLAAFGIDQPAETSLATTARELTRVRHAANEALRTVFGSVSLPEDEAPSVMAARGPR